jgi:Ni,Fe-hydrogenase III small subunit
MTPAAAEAITHQGLARLVAVKEMSLLTEEEEREADALIDCGLTLHREAAIRRRHEEAMAEAEAAVASGDEARMEGAMSALKQANEALEALVAQRREAGS